MKNIDLNPFEKDLKINIEDQLNYTFREHVSVGYMADFEIEDTDVLVHTETNTVYETPERMKEPGITGADAAETTFSFKAIAAGTTLLIIRNYFREDLESEFRYRITVS